MVRDSFILGAVLSTLLWGPGVEPVMGLELAYELTFERPVTWHQTVDGYWSAGSSGGDQNYPGQPDLEWLSLSLDQTWPENGRLVIKIVEADTLSVPGLINPAQPDMITSDTATPPAPVGPDPAIYASDRWFPDDILRVHSDGRLDNESLVSLAWCPYRYNPVRRELIVGRRAVMHMMPDERSPEFPTPVDTIRVEDAVRDAAIRSLNERRGPQPSPSLGGSPDWVWPDDPPIGVEYVVITKATFVSTLRPLIEWKARRGISSGLATVEAIMASYPGEDGAARIRNYIQDAYSHGLLWVVLAGDETVVPVRYAYAGYYSDPGGQYNLQICDMYFVEFSGNWDTDGDGIYGEYLGDDPDLYPELYVGRLPFSTTAEASVIVDKIIAYERGPLDDSYLTKSLHVCADQMRDWSSGVGQHQLVADVTPAGWQNDLSSMVESPSGEDLSPIAPDGAQLTTLIANGAGWVNYYVHGTADRMVVRSAGLNETPYSLVYTHGIPGDGNGHLNSITPTPRPGIHISAACDQGGFDMNTSPFDGSLGESVAERLLFTSQGGAVAFVGQSRWGWVASSWKLISSFYDYVNDPGVPNHIGMYQTLAKTAHSSHRDLIYGNNLYGDPEMPVWKDQPDDLSISGPTTFTAGLPLGEVSITDNGAPLSGALVTISAGDSMWFAGTSDGSGHVSVTWLMPQALDIYLTANKPGHRVSVDTVPLSIITDVNNDEDVLPASFSLGANYPNPFNAGTIIPLTLESPGVVRVDVFDILGRRVRTVAHTAIGAGEHLLSFDGTDDHGRAIGSGVYFARLVTDGRTAIRKMVLLR